MDLEKELARLARQAIIDDDTPILLTEAGSIGFPYGGMSASGLRRERDKGNLEVMRIAGRDWTTLAAIKRMMQKCRRPAKVQGSISSASLADPQPGSSETDPVQSAQDVLNKLEKSLNESSPPTSKRNTKRRGGNVVLMR